jgi:hypothetical protein
LPSPARPEAVVEAVVEAGTLHLAVPYTTRWKVELDGTEIVARPAFGLTDAFDLPSKGQVKMSFASSQLHTLAVLLQFMTWSVLAFVALSRRRRRVVTTSAATLADSEPVIVLAQSEPS